MAFKRKFAKKRVSRKRPVRKTYKTATFAKRVRKVINKAAEHKSYGLHYTNVTCSGVSTALEQLDLGEPLNYIVQGTAAGQRVGDRIRITKAILKGVFTVSPYGSTNNTARPVDVRVVISTNRKDPINLTAPPLSTFLWQAGAPHAMDNSLVDICATLNMEAMKVQKDIRFKIGQSGPTTGEGTVPYNNDYKMTKFVTWDLTKFFPKIIKYTSSNTLLVPSPFMTVIPQPWDNSGYAAGQTNILNFNGDIEFTYVDY